MEDSFFGFDTSAPLEDDGGGRIAEPSEEEYDALNDETFGSAINGDWEEVHENLVRLTDNHNGDTTNCVVVSKAGARGGQHHHQLQQHLQQQQHHQLQLQQHLQQQHHQQQLQHHHHSVSSSNANTPAHARSYRNRNEVDSDLEINLSGMQLDDVDITFDDSDSIMGSSGINLDPSVWASIPVKQNKSLEQARQMSYVAADMANSNPDAFLRANFSSPFQQQQSLAYQQQHQQQQQQQQFSKAMPPFLGLADLQQLESQKGPKISTLEDIERNIIIQQTMQKQQQQQVLNNILQQSPKSPTPTQQQQQQHQQQQQQQLQQQQQQHTNKTQQQAPTNGPPGFNALPTPPPRPSNNFANNMAQHPLSNLLQQQPQPHLPGNRLPPGFPSLPLYPPGLAPHLQQQLPPHPLLNQHALPPNFAHAHHQRPLPNAHLPIALNNFAMHPNFNAMRAAAAAVGIHPAALVPPSPQQQPPPHGTNPNTLLTQAPPNYMNNMFNMRLMQEIQQNHPLLQNVARQQQLQQQQQQHQHLSNNMHHMQQMQQQQLRHHQQQHQQQQQHRRSDGLGANGNLPPDEFDAYANLMSTRDKHWLIGIQLSQLNTDTPYIDDFYYTVYKERKAQLNGDMRHSKAHKDNQLNHPLTQPRGHAQLILVQLGNKNGTRNGQHRERRNSETVGNNHQEQKSTYVFTPLKFENSLGKLQYGSVTAPRKIIDADIMGNDGTSSDAAAANSSSNNGGTAATNSNNAAKSTAASVAAGNASVGPGGDILSTQRKSRHILLHIETIYRIIIKLEDLDNPHAIATIIMKKKKESERILALEQLENANKTSEERAAEANNPQSMNPALKNRFAYEIETKEALVAKLVAGLAYDKVFAMMNVRKGKALLRRIMPYIEHNDIRWNVWIAIFAALQNVVKKDREDVDGILYALYPELKKQLQTADFETMVKLSAAIPFNDNKKSNGVFCSKFGISAVVCLILQAEKLYVSDTDPTLSDALKNNWRQFLDQVATSLNRTIQNHTICAAIESDSIQPMMDHFARFADLKLDSLLALVTEAKQQIN